MVQLLIRYCAKHFATHRYISEIQMDKSTLVARTRDFMD